MKIAIFHNLGPGGGKRALYEYVSLLKEKHTLDLYLLSDKAEEFLDLRPLVSQYSDYHFHDNPQSPLFLRYHQSHQVQKKIAKDIDSKKYDVVFVNHCMLTKAPYILRYLQTPHIYYCQEPFRDFYELPILNAVLKKMDHKSFSWLRKARHLYHVVLKGMTDRKNAQKATKILANSYFSYESIYKAFGVYPTVSYLGIDSKFFNVMPKIEKKAEIVTVGPLDPKKGHEFVIRSLALIDEKNRPALNLVYYSAEENYETYIKKLATDLKVTVNYYKKISYDDVVKIYNQSIITVCAQEMEPFGFTPLESMSCGTPVIAVKEGGMRETVNHQYNGLLVDRNEFSLSQAIIGLLQDKKLWQTLQKNGLETVKDWTWQKQTEKLEQIFLSVSESHEK